MLKQLSTRTIEHKRFLHSQMISIGQQELWLKQCCLCCDADLQPGLFCLSISLKLVCSIIQARISVHHLLSMFWKFSITCLVVMTWLFRVHFCCFFCLHVCALAEKEFGTVSQCCLGHFHLQKTDCLRFRKRFHSYDCFR